MKSLRRTAVGVVAGALLSSSSAVAGTTAPLSWTGTLVIDGGGSNTTTVRYTSLTVQAPASGPPAVRTINLSSSKPTLVIRGGAEYAEPCASAAECWDSEQCVQTDPSASSDTGRAGVCAWSDLPLPANCAATQDVTEVHSGLDACASLLRAGQRDGNGVFGAAANDCAGVGARIARLDPACSAQETREGWPVPVFRDGWEKVVFDMLARSQQEFPTSGAGTLADSDVRAHLRRIATWYDGYRALHPASGGAAANDLVWEKTSRVLGTFWAGVYAQAGVPEAGAAVPSDGQLDLLFRNSIEADRMVLVAALTRGPDTSIPIRTAPLIELMGDALQSVSERLGLVGIYHDMACRFRKADARCGDGGERTEISALVHLLASAADPVALTSTLNQGTPGSVTANWSQWKAVFSALASQQSGTAPGFQAAVLDALVGVAPYSPDLIAPPAPRPGAPAPSFPRPTPPVMGFARIVQEARVRANSYDLTGLFDSRYQGVLRAGIHEARITNVRSQAQANKEALEAEIQKYRANRVSLATHVLSQMTNLAKQQSIIDQINQRVEREFQLHSDLAGLRNTVEVEEARFGDFMQAYGNLTQLVAGRPDTEVRRLNRTIMVGPGDARWPSTAVFDGANPLASILTTSGAGIAGLQWTLSAAAGDILTFNTSGSWSPTCALRSSQFTNPLTGSPDRFSVPAGALTGPEGYLLNVVGSSFEATSNQSVHSVDRYSNEGHSSKYCAGAKASAKKKWGWDTIGVEASLEAYASAEWCNVHDDGKRINDVTSDTTAEGAETRMSGAFATGIRIERTPFPSFPAGSLLAVQVSKNGTHRGDIVDAQVLQRPSTSIVISGDVDVFLAVNDLVDPAACGTPDTSRLTVTVNQLTPFGSVAQELGNAMGTALTQLRARQGLLIEQGRVGPHQMAELRDMAYVSLTKACGVGCSLMSHYPAEVLRLFDAWISKELASIERKVDARTVSRELLLIQLDHAALANDLGKAGEQARLLRLIPTWILKDLGTQLMQEKARVLLDQLVGDLYPIVDLRTPGVLDALAGNVVARCALDALLGKQPIGCPVAPDWTGDVVDWSQKAADAAGAILGAVIPFEARLPALQDRIIALGIPDPALGSSPPSGRWQRVSPERAAVVWDALRAARAAAPSGPNPFVSISVEPTDLYPMYWWSTDVLGCSDATPLITGMAIFMVRPTVDGGPDFAGLYTPVSVGPNLVFPAAKELKNYRVDNPDWLSQFVRVTAGQPNELDHRAGLVLGDTATPRERAGFGLSPFAKFDISLGAIAHAPTYPAPMDDATEMVIVFRVLAANVSSESRVLQPMCP